MTTSLFLKLTLKFANRRTSLSPSPHIVWWKVVLDRRERERERGTGTIKQVSLGRIRIPYYSPIIIIGRHPPPPKKKKNVCSSQQTGSPSPHAMRVNAVRVTGTGTLGIVVVSVWHTRLVSRHTLRRRYISFTSVVVA
mmetsp:Transcript_11552/g.30578  ORF Transcript_11552/g.30578 Transcript_11552/m.30578 type:complete len:138 (-) Transcript_11552:8-421(-)